MRNEFAASLAVVGIVVHCLFVGLCSGAQGDVNTLLYNTIRSTDATVVAAATATVTTGGTIQWENTIFKGVGNRALNKVMDADRCYHMNTMGELLVALAALQLHADTAFTSTLDDTLNTKYTPSNLTFTNPKNGFNVTYKQLLQHTSSILDTSFASFATTGTSVTSLSTFVSSYFVTFTSGVAALNSAVFSTNQPGIATSYGFARANTALLSFVLENVIADKVLPYTGLDDYITATFLQPLGMSNTFFLRSASFPGITTMPSFSGTFTSIDKANSTFSASFYSGCVVDQMSTTSTLHPAIYADYMGYTTMGDMVRLMRGLFYTSAFSTIVSLMKDSISITTSVARVSGQRGQGLGLMYFNGDTLCTAAKSTSVVSACPVSNLSTVYGYVSNRDFMEHGFFCTDTSTASAGLVCVATSIVHTSSSTRGPSNVMAMAAVTYQDLIGNVTVSQAPTPTAEPEAVQSEWFGVYCFLGVYLSIIGTYFIAAILQWLFQPAALAQATDSGGAASIAYGAPNSPNRGDASMLGD